MIELLWFAGGAVVALCAGAVFHVRHVRAAAQRAAVARRRRAAAVATIEHTFARLRERAALAELPRLEPWIDEPPPGQDEAPAQTPADVDAAAPAAPHAGPPGQTATAAAVAAAVDATVDPVEDVEDVEDPEHALGPADEPPSGHPIAAAVEPLDPEGAAEAAAEEAGAAEALTCTVALQALPLAQALSHELANIVSGVEGGAFRLIEAAPLPPTRASAAEGLWLAIRRLRRFHDKIRAFVRVPEPAAGTTPVESLLISLRDELETSELGLQMVWDLPRTLPLLRGASDQLLDGLVFLSMALQHLERGALRLSIEVEPGFETDAPQVQLELRLEWDEDPGRMPQPGPPGAGFLIARTAACNLLRLQGGSAIIDHEPGHLARALVRLPAVDVDATALRPMLDPDSPPAGDMPEQMLHPHRFGGVLLLESDPTVRSMLASELKACGRSVFACADGAAARSLMQATPDRFEMLVVDQESRLGARDNLAATAMRLCPDMKVFVLSDADQGDLPEEIAARVHRIRKPFGVHELRRALAALFGE